mgnify:CR=1 FL=1
MFIFFKHRGKTLGAFELRNIRGVHYDETSQRATVMFQAGTRCAIATIPSTQAEFLQFIEQLQN